MVASSLPVDKNQGSQSKAPTFSDMLLHSIERFKDFIQFKTPTQRDTLTKLKPWETKCCMRVEGFSGLCVECQNCTVCQSAPVTDSLRLRFAVSPGICQNGELHQRRAGTQQETRPHVWCALTTGETSEREKHKKMRERGEQLSTRQTCHSQNWWFCSR